MPDRSLLTEDETKSGDNLTEYTVSEIAFSLKRTVEGAFGLVRVRGELSGIKRAGSGHLYFALKDDRAVLDGVCWRGTQRSVSVELEDGLEVICTGQLSTYPARSRYQLIVESIEPAGVGALMALLEERRKTFEAEGLFDADRKRALPFLPRTIGIVTSPSGAVIRDILHRIEERFPCQILLWPVMVQGQGAADQIAQAISGFDAWEGTQKVPRPDLLILARGGGSIEDLWSFNEESVVRAVSACRIPLISAVGHETDTTLVDFVSDQRAPTPTAAAEFAVPVRHELLHALE
ncbi:MAG: exodeoxyribonuclease VII large subunit, partial [Pseudomonadota bacterium]